MNKFVRITLLFAVLGFAAPFALAGPNDWPQWRGPNRDGISKETGILKTWPETGPKVLWKAPSGDGYSGIVVANGRLYTMHATRSEEVVVSLDAGSGKEIWRFVSDNEVYQNQFGNGPRSTPTVDGELVFTLSGNGKLYALNAKTGAKVWNHDLRTEFGGQIPTWGVSTSPLVDGEMLLVDVGGSGGNGLMAFNKKSGKVVWKSNSSLPGYSAPIAVTVNGIKQILFFTGTALISASPADGKQYWSYTWRTSYDVNAATPIFIPPDKVFISSGYNVGAAVLRMKVANGSVKIEELWKSQVMRNHFASSVLVGDYLYGFDEATLKCININTQEEKWGKRGLGKGSLIYADGHLIVLSERGKLLLVEANPAAEIEKASAEVLRGRCWTVPTLANGKLYVKNQAEILCLDVTNSGQL
jgi:outer membrane protein assembly factor BamB